MQVTTTGRKPKAFAWSYSKLKNYETCPKRSWHLDHAKDIREEESEQLAYGNTLHKVLAEAIAGKAPLPPHFAKLKPWVEKVTAAGNGPAPKILVEQQLAIRADFGPTEWFGNDAWYRGIADVIKIVGPVAAVLDWKTGKIIEDGVQLALMAACVFAHHPSIQKIRTEFVWLKEDAVTRADFSRDDMPKVWAGVLPRVQSLENALKTATFPPKPSFLCRKWCPVEHCPHHGV
jgi:hypothetical protein